MITNERMRKVLSVLLVFCMVLSCVPTTAFAVAEDGLCEHHGEHTADCGYIEGKSPCGYSCAECGAAAASAQLSGEQPIEPEAGPPAEPEQPAEPVCTCETKCTDDAINAGCEVCAADLAACEGEIVVNPAVAAVQALIAALPDAEVLAAMSTEEQKQVYDALLGADDAYQALNEEQKGQLAEENAKLDALFAYFNNPNMAVPAAEIPTVDVWDIYANGTPLLIVAYGDGTTIYLDTDGDGEKDDGEQSLHEACGEDAWPDGSTNYQYCTIYGGSKDGAVESTRITMTGGTVEFIYGGSGAGGSVTGDTEVIINGGKVHASVYGGGNQSSVGGTASVTMNGGTVGLESNGHGIYGGGNDSSVGSAEVTINGGEANDVYGGGNDGTVNGSAKVTMTGGTVESIYGGGYYGGAGSTEVLIDTGSTVGDEYYGTVYGGTVYGGSRFGGSVTGTASVTIKGTVGSSVYGGGAGGSVGSSEVLIDTGGKVGSGGFNGMPGDVYGGSSTNNYISGNVTGDTNVTIRGTVTGNVYGGGGSSANVEGSTNVLIDTGGKVAGDVYGGGYQSSVAGKASVTIKGTVTESWFGMYSSGGNVYGGSYNGGTVGSAHVKCENGSADKITLDDGIYRTASDGDFQSVAADETTPQGYFEYLSADHYTISAIADSEKHAIDCTDETCILKLTDAAEPHIWNAHADGATCGVCKAEAAASVTADGTTAYYYDFENALGAAEGKSNATLKLFANVETITVSTGGFILNPNGKSISKLDFASGSSSIGIASKPANTPAVTMAAPGVFATPSSVTLDSAWFTSATTSYVVVKEDDNLKLAKGITEDMVTVVESATYSGWIQTPAVTVTWTDGVNPVDLEESFDYAVGYKDSNGVGGFPLDADTYTVTVTGMGSYVGEVEKTYTIEPKSLTDATVTAPNQTYTGSKLTPAVTVELTGYTITSDDYTVSYSPDTLTDAGEYEITITGNGNFTGTKNSTFEIKPVDISDRTANSPDQITIFGVGDFTEPTIPGVAGETVPGTFQYSITAASGATEVTDGDAAAVKASLATLEKDKDVVVNWKFSPTTGNYTGTKAGSFTVTAKNIEFKVGNDAASATNAINVLISSTEYGKTWNERISLKSGSITASVGNTTVSGNYTIVPDNGALTDRPGVGTHSYTVKFTGGGYTDVTVFTGSLTVTAKPVTVTADDVIVPLGTNMETVQFTYTVSGLCGTDTLTKAPVLALSTDTDTSKEGEYTITPSNADAGSNYKMEYKTGLLKVRGQRTITVAAAANGKVSVSHNSAIEGTQVTITVTPDEGKEINKVSITDKDGNPVDITDNGDGTYTYQQPDSDVTIEVTFKSMYEIVKGNGGNWTKGSTSALSFTANGPLDKFTGIQVDGKTVDEKNYTAKADQTTITLKASYLETLKTGNHTITVLYTDGETEGTFTVQAKPTTPATGDDSNIMLWSGMLCVSTLGLLILLADRKRRSSTK